MRIEDRIAQLVEVGLDAFVCSLGTKDEDLNFVGIIVARFENGAGIEYIEVSAATQRNAREDSFLYKALVAEIGLDAANKRAKKSSCSLDRLIDIETHIIVDITAKLTYRFDLPSRKYLKEETE